MGLLIVPGADAEPWPTLGGQVCQLLETYCVHGPGDLRGRQYTLDDEKRALIYRWYEVYPQGHPRAGKRRFKRAGLSVRKGTAKTELAAAVGFAELHPEGPVRCDGFDAYGQPVGRPVTDPYIPMVAYTEEQTEELAYGALFVMCTEGPDADLFDAGLDRNPAGRGRRQGRGHGQLAEQQRWRQDDVPALRRDAPLHPAEVEGVPSDDAGEHPQADPG
ncbi:hypothetical protein [Streptomyces sp. IBSBF 2435]|uniref:hypothetical protein n=1 Tax=Streptomyces sp. IBSBF 2435 TaxID=2903531 RepID=UPI002FDBF624